MASTMTGAVELVGPDEVAARLGVRPNTVSMWKARGLLPAPAVIVSRVPVWPWPIIRAWASATGRLDEGEHPTNGADRARVAELRALVVTEVEAMADEASGILDAAGVGTILRRPADRQARRDGTGRFASLDGHGNDQGEWDWFYALPDQDRRWLLREHTDTAGNLSDPDQVADLLAKVIGTTDLDAAMATWVRCVRILDAASALRQRVTFRRCGHLFGPLALSYDAVRLFSSWAEATAYVAELDGTDDEDEAGPLVARLGPSPLDMDFPEWAAELAALEERAVEVEARTSELDFVAADDQAVYARMAELLPPVIDPSAFATLEELYVAAVGAYLAVA